MDIRTSLQTFAKGFCMGTADAVPGVSGGTIALLLGIYERLVAAISALVPGDLRRMLAGLHPRKDGTLRGAVLDTDIGFLLALGVGMVTAVLLVSSAVEALAETHPIPLFAFFLGLIAASGVVLSREIPIDTVGQVVAGVGGLVVAFVVSGQPTLGLGTSTAVIFVAGAIAVSAMILPGLSGALLLILLNKYVYMAAELSGFADAVLSVALGADPAVLVDAGREVAIFVVGGVVGLLTVSQVIRRALATYRYPTLAFLVGLVIGAVRAPVVEITHHAPVWDAAGLATVAGFAGLGAALVLLVDRYALTVEL